MIEKYLLVFFISMVPLIELRGAIPIAVAMLDLEIIPAAVVCAVGNLIPVPLIYLYAQKFLLWGAEKPPIASFCRFCLKKGEKAEKKLSENKSRKRHVMTALALFVGIPIPGTGAWTGTLGASFLKLGLKETGLSVLTGVVIAAFLMVSLSMAGIHVFGF